MTNETQTPSTPLTRACENVLKAHSGELVLYRQDHLTVKENREFTIEWAINRLEFALKHPRLSARPSEWTPPTEES